MATGLALDFFCFQELDRSNYIRALSYLRDKTDVRQSKLHSVHFTNAVPSTYLARFDLTDVEQDEFTFTHHDLLASNLGKKASMNLGAIQNCRYGIIVARFHQPVKIDFLIRD